MIDLLVLKEVSKEIKVIFYSVPPALCKFWVDKGGIFKSCPRVPTSEGLGEIFEGDFVGSSVRRPGSEDPNRHQRKLPS